MSTVMHIFKNHKITNTPQLPHYTASSHQVLDGMEDSKI